MPTLGLRDPSPQMAQAYLCCTPPYEAEWQLGCSLYTPNKSKSIHIENVTNKEASCLLATLTISKHKLNTHASGSLSMKNTSHSIGGGVEIR